MTFQDTNWFSDMLLRIKKKIDGQDNEKRVKEFFRRADVNNSGKINSSVFKTVLMDLGIGISVQEMTRLMRYLDKESDGMIDYSKFLKSVKRIDCKKINNI